MSKHTSKRPEALPKDDPFNEPLEDKLVLNDVYFSDARKTINIEGMDYSFLKPPYILFEDQLRTKRKLKKVYSQHEFLLLYGYSGCGKTTVLTQFHENYPSYVHLISDFSSLSPSQMVVSMGGCIGLPLKYRTSEIFILHEHLKARHGTMFLFDEVTLDEPKSLLKLELLRKIYMATRTPICICGVNRLYHMLYDSRRYNQYCSLITRLDEHEMQGMKQSDAANYLAMLGEKEHVRFSYPASQALKRAPQREDFMLLRPLLADVLLLPE